MDIIKIFFKDGSDAEVACSSWYHKPAILKSLAFCLQRYFDKEILFVCSSKYGCSQFLPKLVDSYFVHCVVFEHYKRNLPWIVPEFNDSSKGIVEFQVRNVGSKVSEFYNY